MRTLPFTLAAAVTALCLHAGVSIASAAPITADRVDALPLASKATWQAYLERSQALAREQAEALAKEVQAAGLSVAVQAPEGPDFKPAEKPEPSWFSEPTTVKLAETVLTFQAPTGGWSKHTDYAKGPRTPGMQWTSQSAPGKKPHYLATIDNGATTREIQFLAGVWKATGREEFAQGVRRGIDFLLAAQYPNGGWPQVFPLEGGYHDDITHNDDAMTNVMSLLKLVIDGAPEFACVNDGLRERVRTAFDLGVKCLLDTQVVIDGKRTVWCAQHDAITLAPTSARKMEPATLSGMESSAILRFLMTIEKPSAEIVASINAGLSWMDAARITNLKKGKVNGKTGYIEDPTSTEVYWARFYSLETGKPIFPGRDGVVYATYNEMIAKNKGGYDYFTNRPNSLLGSARKKWEKLLAGK